MTSETPNHRAEWQNTEKLVLASCGAILALEIAAAYLGETATRSLTVVSLSLLTVVMTLAGRRHRLNAANWRRVAGGRDD